MLHWTTNPALLRSLYITTATRSPYCSVALASSATVRCFSSRSVAQAEDRSSVQRSMRRIMKLKGLIEGRTVVLHKPAGYVSSKRREGKSGLTVYDLLRGERPDCTSSGEDDMSASVELRDDHGQVPALADADEYHMCGRLDADSSGLMIMSQNTDLVAHIIDRKDSAGSALEKEYQVEVVGLLHEDGTLFTRDEVAMFHRGTIRLRQEKSNCRPCKFWTMGSPRVIETRDGGKILAQQTCGIVLREGRYRQVRRMIAAVGKRCVELKRVRIGGAEIGELVSREGDWRFLSDEELSQYLGYRRPQTDAWKRERKRKETQLQKLTSTEQRGKWKRIE